MGWPPLPQLASLVGHKCAVVPSQSPKKAEAKVAQQIQVQHRLSQQALQPALVHIFLPSAPVGAPRSFETTKKSIAKRNDEWECLNQENRAGQALFTQFEGIAGMTRVVLTQPARPSGIDEPRVPRIQEDELCMRNARVSLSDQARVQNIKYFSEQDKQRQKQPILTAAVDQLTSSIARPTPQQQAPPPARQQQQGTTPLPPADDSTGAEQMDMGVQETEMDQCDVAMGDGDGRTNRRIWT